MMQPITSYDALLALLRAQWKPGVVTNAVPSGEAYREELRAGSLYAHTWPGGLLLLRRREGFQRLSFCLQRDAALPDWEPELPTVLEIAARPRDGALLAAGLAWQDRGFRLLFTRQRMTRQPGPAGGEAVFPVRIAAPEEQAEVQALLRDCFDPRTGCLPVAAALKEDLNQGRVLTVGACGGILHQVPAPGGTELRHLAVAPRLRRQGAAQSLLTAYLRREGGRVSRVWVRRDNPAAISLYEKNGYAPDQWTSKVYWLDGDRKDVSNEYRTRTAADFE